MFIELIQKVKGIKNERIFKDFKLQDPEWNLFRS